MIKGIILLTAMLLPCCVRAEPSIDTVDSVKINGYEVVSESVTLSTLAKAMGAKGQVVDISWSDCTANYTVQLSFPGATVDMELFSEENDGLDLNAILAKRDFMDNTALKASPWIYWPDISLFTGIVQVGELAVTRKLTFDEFSRAFPISASADNQYSLVEGESMSYYVAAASLNEDGSIDLPYVTSVYFTFKNGILIGLSILQGIAC